MLDTLPNLNVQGKIFTECEGITSGTHGFIVTVANTGAQVVAGTADQSHLGVVQLDAGTTASGLAVLATNATSARLGGGQALFEADVRIPIIATSGEDFSLLIGLIDVITGAAGTDGVYFRMSSASTAAALVVTRSNSTETATVTGWTPVLNTYYRFKFIVNAAASRVDFYVNDALIGSSTTNIPSAAGRELGVGISLLKTAGTTSRVVDVDYIKYLKDFDTQR